MHISDGMWYSGMTLMHAAIGLSGTGTLFTATDRTCNVY
jgi:hypothetical protein